MYNSPLSTSRLRLLAPLFAFATGTAVSTPSFAFATDPDEDVTNDDGDDESKSSGDDAEPEILADGPSESTAVVAAPPARKAARGERPVNSVYVEGLGAGVLYSINYDRLVIPQLAVRAGFGFVGMSASASSGGTTSESKLRTISVPITASYVGVHKGKNALEVLAGATINYSWASGTVQSGSTLTSASGSGVAPLGTFGAGYRLHPVGKAGFHFRIGAMGLVGRGLAMRLQNMGQNKVGMLPWGYISFGASF